MIGLLILSICETEDKSVLEFIDATISLNYRSIQP